MEKRQDTDRPQTDRMSELAQAVVSTPSLALADDNTIGEAAACETEACGLEGCELEVEDVRSEEVLVAQAPVEAANDEAAVSPEEDVAEAAEDEAAADAVAEDANASEEESLEAADAEDAQVEAAYAAEPEELAADDYEELGPQERLGRSLRDARCERKMALDDIARTTKIPKASLEHIEAGRFDSLPGDVFARGFLRSYARCIGMDGDDVVRRYAQCGLSPAPVSSDLADAVLSGRRKAKVPAKAPRRARGTKPARARTERAEGETVATRAKTQSGVEARQEGSADGNAVRKVLRDAFDLGVQVRSNIARSTSARRAATSHGATSHGTTSHSATSHAKHDSTQQTEVAAERAESECKAREKRTRTFVPPSFDYESDMTHRGPLTLGVIILVIVATLTMSYLLRHPGTSTDGFTMNEAPASETLPGVERA